MTDSTVRRLIEWCNINTGTRNVEGLDRFRTELLRDFAPLGGEANELSLPPEMLIDSHGVPTPIALGKAISISKRREAPIHVFLGIHMDTVFDVPHAFQKAELIDENILRGPGAADAKGGLMVLLRTLEIFETSSAAENIGWEVLINPDEEIGSPGSGLLFREIARRNALGLIFEPALPGGAMVAARKGSGNFTLVVRGRAAHAGRDPTLGRNAIEALAEFILTIGVLNELQPSISLNVGKIEGGGPMNIVPDLAIGRFNVRVTTPQDQFLVEEYLHRAVTKLHSREGVTAELHGRFHSPPRPFQDATQELAAHFDDCASELGVTLEWKDSGGTCDGNRLAAEGLPVLDSLGPRGGQIHTMDEYIEIDSIEERANLAAAFLSGVAEGEIHVPDQARRA